MNNPRTILNSEEVSERASEGAKKALSPVVPSVRGQSRLPLLLILAALAAAKPAPAAAKSPEVTLGGEGSIELELEPASFSVGVRYTDLVRGNVPNHRSLREPSSEVEVHTALMLALAHRFSLGGLARFEISPRNGEMVMSLGPQSQLRFGSGPVRLPLDFAFTLHPGSGHLRFLRATLGAASEDDLGLNFSAGLQVEKDGGEDARASAETDSCVLAQAGYGVSQNVGVEVEVRACSNDFEDQVKKVEILPGVSVSF